MSILKCGPCTCLINGRISCFLYLSCQGQDRHHQLARQKIQLFIITEGTYVNVCTLHSAHYFCQILTTISMCQQILVQILGVIFHINVQWKLHCSVWMDRMKPVAIYFMNMPSTSVPDIRYTHNASWCSKYWMSGTLNGHLIAPLCSCPLNSSLQHITLDI